MRKEKINDDNRKKIMKAGKAQKINKKWDYQETKYQETKLCLK